MSYYHDLKNTMTEEKKKNAKNDYFAFYIGRPLSYILTVPFLQLNIKPNFVSILSTVEVVIASVVLSASHNIKIAVIGWLLFFLWNLLDGVDGNIARLKKISTDLGSVYDAMSGYTAMFLFFFSAGIYAFNISDSKYAYIQIIIGAISGMSELFPRLVMHKAKNEVGNVSNIKSVSNKSEFGFTKKVALNVTSISGLVQPILLFCILFSVTNWFNYFYCVVNVMIMLVSIYKILK